MLKAGLNNISEKVVTHHWLTQSLGEDKYYVCNYLVDVRKYLTYIIWPSVIVASMNKRLPSLVGDKVFGKYFDVSAKDHEPMRDVLI